MAEGASCGIRVRVDTITDGIPTYNPLCSWTDVASVERDAPMVSWADADRALQQKSSAVDQPVERPGRPRARTLRVMGADAAVDEEEEDGPPPYGVRDMLRILAPVALSFWGGAACVLVARSAEAVLGLYSPDLFAEAYDRAARLQPIPGDLWWRIFIVFAASRVLGTLVSFSQGLLTMTTTKRLQCLMLERVLEQPIVFFDRFEPGELIGRVMREVTGAVLMLLYSAPGVLVSAGTLAYACARCSQINWAMMLIAVVSKPLELLIEWRRAGVMRDRDRDTIALNANCANMVADAILNIRRVFVFNGAQHTLGVFMRILKELYDHLLTDVFINAAHDGLTLVIVEALQGFFLWYSLTQISEGRITVGEYTAFHTFSGSLNGSVSSIWGTVCALRQAPGAAARSMQLIDPDFQAAASQARERESAAFVCRGPPEIQFQRVSFRYSKSTPWIVRDMSASVAAGSTTFVIGPSGQGKTTLFLLLLKLITPDSGTVSLNGRDLGTVRASLVRQAVGLVPQEPLFFRQSLKFNMVYGLPEDVGDDAVWAALERTRIAERVRELAHGLDSDVMQWLTPGERQRVSIASMLVRRPVVALLDEPTSALDPPTSAHVWETLREVLADITALAIVHQLFVIRDEEPVVVVSGGGVEAAGPFQEVRLTSKFTVIPSA